jgi:hypothetical protein
MRPLGIGGGDDAAATTRSSTPYVQRFSAHATCEPHARKPWLSRRRLANICWASDPIVVSARFDHHDKLKMRTGVSRKMIP